MTGNAPNPRDDPATDRPPGLPHWVKWLALSLVIGMAVLVVAVLLIGGEHGPGIHRE